MTRTKKSLLFLSSLALGIFLFASYSDAETTTVPENDTVEDVNSEEVEDRPTETETPTTQSPATSSTPEDLPQTTNPSTSKNHEAQPISHSQLEELPTDNELNPVSKNSVPPPSENTSDIAKPSANITLSPSTQTRLLNLSANLSNRYDAAILRLEKISQRLEKRLAKIHQQGFDTAAAEKPLESALAYLQEARATLQNIDTQVSSFVYAKNPALEWPKVKTTYTNTHTLLTNAKQNLGETISLLKSAPVQTKPSDEPNENHDQNSTNLSTTTEPKVEREDESKEDTNDPSPTSSTSKI